MRGNNPYAIQLKRPESIKISVDLQRNYRDINLEDLFGPHGFAPIDLFHHADTTPIDSRDMEPENNKYRRIVQHSIESFVADCIQFGVLEVTDNGELEMTKEDYTLMVSERSGFRVELIQPDFPVYRKRMDTSGSIEFTADGEYAEEGMTYQGSLSW